MQYKSYTDLNDVIRNNISTIQAYNFDLIVGLPRSGIPPAYMIALYLNVGCTDLSSLIRNVELKNGITRKVKKNIDLPHDAKKILLVDDSINSGESLNRDLELIPMQLRERITTLAIYSSKASRKDIDLFLEHIPMPRLFEWNIFHHPMIAQSCVDIDGVLCVDPTEEENDDGAKYIDFLKNAKPLFLPTTKIHSLVTSRLEKYRKETEVWLANNHIQYEQLIMLDLPNKEARQRKNAYGSHKANCYRSLKTVLFIESDRKQAVEICRLSGKPVYCLESNRLYNPSLTTELYRDPLRVKKYIPSSIKKMLKYLFRIF